MSGSRRRRRRRRGSAVQRTPEQLRQRPRRRPLGFGQTVLAGAVTIICIALIALIWITTERAINEQYDEAEGRVEAMLGAQAATLAIQVHSELAMVDQSLAVLQNAWDTDQASFSLAKWQKIMPGLTAVSRDLFIANDQHVVVQDILPAAVGQGIGSAYATFSTGSLEPIQFGDDRSENALVVDELGQGGVVRQYLMYLVRPLAKPKGWLIGASYQSKALTDVFAVAGLGQDGFAALVDSTHGGIQAIAGRAALQPQLTIGDSPMFQSMRSRPGGGTWTGRTPIDGTNRIVAFRKVPDRDLFVLVGAGTAMALGPAGTWARAANSVAAVATLLVLGIGGGVFWELRNWRRNRHRQRALAQAEDMLESMQGELAGLRARTATDMAQLQAVMGNVTDGVAIFDVEHRLAARNRQFVALSGLGEAELRDGLPLDELFRHQAAAGVLGSVPDIQAEVDRRMALLQPESGTGEIADTAPDGSPRVLRAERMRDGSLVLVLRSTAFAPPDVVSGVAVPKGGAAGTSSGDGPIGDSIGAAMAASAARAETAAEAVPYATGTLPTGLPADFELDADASTDPVEW